MSIEKIIEVFRRLQAIGQRITNIPTKGRTFLRSWNDVVIHTWCALSLKRKEESPWKLRVRRFDSLSLEHLFAEVDRARPSVNSDEISLRVHVAMPIAVGSRSRVEQNQSGYWKSCENDGEMH